MTERQKPIRRYLQFSLRMFLVVVTLGCVWLGWQVNRANQQRKAVDWVLQTGGSVSYEYKVDDDGLKTMRPKWVRNLFDKVVAVNLATTEVSDLTPLANLKSLKYLYLYTTPVRDLTPLANLTSLSRLDLDDTQVSDLSPLVNRKKMMFLQLSNTPVHDLTPLANLTSLHSIDLDETQVNDLTPLVNLKRLERLRLDWTPVSEKEIAKLKQALPNCEISTE